MGTLRADAKAWAGLLLLLLGLGLADKSFSVWRNDRRNFAHANGVYPTSAELGDTHTGRLERRLQPHSVLLSMAAAGGVLFVVGAALLIRVGSSLPQVLEEA